DSSVTGVQTCALPICGSDLKIPEVGDKATQSAIKSILTNPTDRPPVGVPPGNVLAPSYAGFTTDTEKLLLSPLPELPPMIETSRSEERRVGKEWSTRM